MELVNKADDDYSDSGYFLRWPYGGDGPYIRTYDVPPVTKPWAARLDVEYVETFDRLENLGGHLLIDTAPRLGLAAFVNHLEERLPHGRYDALQVGDCNLIYRFAQGTWGEFHAGLGCNWLNDRDGTDLGFNFIYRADIYPRRPWVLSATIDCGTLGHAGLFRGRTTVGALLHGVEAYTGYEYSDIGRAHWNGVVAGLRLWF